MLNRLGLADRKLAGEADPDDILGRALTGNVGQDDAGTADVTSRTGDGPLWVDCGVETGYFAGKLEAIASLAAIAKERGLMVAWS